jgi:hypothetical protein
MGELRLGICIRHQPSPHILGILNSGDLGVFYKATSSLDCHNSSHTFYLENHFTTMPFPPSIGVKIMTSLGLHAHPVSSLLLPTVPCYAGPAIIVNFLINQGLRIRTSLAGNGASKELKRKDLRETGRLEVVLQSLGDTFPLFASSSKFLFHVGASIRKQLI